MTMESYIVRIYRREVGDAIAGVVEEALSRRTKPFHSLAELTELLRRPPRALRRSSVSSERDSGGRPL